MTRFVQPVCLWDGNDDLGLIANKTGWINGFAGEERYGTLIGKLQEVQVEILHLETCLTRNPDIYAELLTSYLFCGQSAIALSGSYGGSGLIVFKEGNWFIRGIVAMGSSPYFNFKIDGYTDVAQHQQWIGQYIVRTIPSKRIDNSDSITLAQSYDLNRTQCGDRQIPINFLMYNTREAKDHHWPWHAAIFHLHQGKFGYNCGGSLIDTHTILTAAHCIYTDDGLISTNRIQVHLGRMELNDTTNRVQVHNVTKLIPHPKFVKGSVHDDIALIKLANNIDMTHFVKPICLWDKGSEMEWITKSNGIVAGFGKTERSSVSNHLRETTINVINSMKCIESNPDTYGKVLTSNMFCGKANGSASACNGDSGGALVFEFAGSWFVRGLVSFIPGDSTKSCDISAYTVFTDVAKYRYWIEQYVEPTNPSNVNDQLIDDHPNIQYLSKDECGISPQADRRINDQTAQPWIGLIEIEFSKNSFHIWCQVTLINEWYVVGPAHCYDSRWK
ncbi:hypothetical protein ZHAS_00013583 [Anopheles sinensis]|uniref:Peptidase S1 domain-containing protein n=1 Tax=Anopheles sinensis TaxID=74873 RepID=A0A084W5V0_ANOSI|nr:hypothetical protein ZHAS_00013583 [Anopheles sinensis]